MNRIILASGSPRRRELLAKAGISFTVEPAKGAEISDKKDPGGYAEDLSFHKAREIFEKTEGAVTVIGADTIVVLEREGTARILGKPRDRDNAADMLRSLQGHSHHVITGVTILIRDDSGRCRRRSFHESTKVHVLPMTEEEILWYLGTGEADDKAGAYGIQGRFGVFVSGIEGDYDNVVGLPTARLWHVLREEGMMLQ